jgi:hypothetical protein
MRSIHFIVAFLKAFREEYRRVMRLAVCGYYGHDTEGWEIIPDRFFKRQYGHDPYSREPHIMVPMWFHFFGHGKYPWKWEKQECSCKRCGELFWEADLIPLKEKTK